MRFRFFVTILVSLFAVVGLSTALHQYFAKQEVIRLIDRQVREAAAAVLDSELGNLRFVDIEKAEDILSEELGEDRIGKFFIIRNDAGEVLFESTSVQLLPVKDIPQDKQWVTLTGKGQFIRVLNLKLPQFKDRSLQVGLVVEENIVSPSYLSTSNLVFFGLIVFISIAVSWILASNLIRPISLLSNYIDPLTDHRGGKFDLPRLPSNLQQFLKRDSNSKDELNRLFVGFEKLIERVNKGYSDSKLLSYQMAHELKTPLAVIESIVSESAMSKLLDPERAKVIQDEIFAASETITAFLAWAEVENSAEVSARIHVVKISRILDSIEKRLNQHFLNRIQVKVTDDFSVLTNLEQIDQVIENLISNACNYSPSNEPVIVEAHANIISVTDKGGGIPKIVLDRMGQPFNKGEMSVHGSGLGMAYIFSVCKQSGWIPEIRTAAGGTKIDITFPVLGNEVTQESNL